MFNLKNIITWGFQYELIDVDVEIRYILPS